jgi:hypothetical protein
MGCSDDAFDDVGPGNASVLVGLTAAAQQALTVSGRLSATEQEAQEGYFAIDAQTMIVVKPGGDIHAYLKSRLASGSG